MTQKTALYDEHIKLKAKMVEFSGWQMPVLYSSIVEEHLATRHKAGIFDVSHMAEIRITGENARAFLESVIPTRMDKLVPGKSMYSALCNEQGGVVDDIFVYMISDIEYYIVSNAGTHEKDIAWLESKNLTGVTIDDESGETAKIDLQGPASLDILSAVIDNPELKNLNRFFFRNFTFNNKEIMIAKSGYTGETGYELYVPNALAPVIWSDLLEKGAQYGISPAGLGARDTLRLESCYSLYGHELSDSISLIEAGLKWLVSSETDYIGRKELQQQIDLGPERTLITFELTGKGIPRDGQDVYLKDEKIGYVTSGTWSPTYKKGIGMALVTKEKLQTGDFFDIMIRNKPVQAVAVPRPFYKYNG